MLLYTISRIINPSKKSLKIPREQAESEYRRRTDNSMAKRKRTKGNQRSTKHTHKIKDRVTRALLRCSGRVDSSCTTKIISPRALYIYIYVWYQVWLFLLLFVRFRDCSNGVVVSFYIFILRSFTLTIKYYFSTYKHFVFVILL